MLPWLITSVLRRVLISLKRLCRGKREVRHTTARLVTEIMTRYPQKLFSESWSLDDLLREFNLVCVIWDFFIRKICIVSDYLKYVGLFVPRSFPEQWRFFLSFATL